METKISQGGIIRSWSQDARSINFRNFRFWIVITFGILCTIAGAMYVIIGLISDFDSFQQLVIVFLFGGIIAAVGLATLSLRSSPAYGWGQGLGCLILGSGLIIFIVTVVPMIDPNNDGYGKPPGIPFALSGGMTLLGIVFLWICRWMDDVPVSKKVTPDVAP